PLNSLISVAFARILAEILREFVWLGHKCVGIRRGRLLGRNVRPALRILPVKFQPFVEIWLGIALDRVDRALRLAHAAVDALIGVDNEHVLALVKTVHGAHFDAIGVLTRDETFGDDVSHRFHTFWGPTQPRSLPSKGRPSRPRKGLPITIGPSAQGEAPVCDEQAKENDIALLFIPGRRLPRDKPQPGRSVL